MAFSLSSWFKGKPETDPAAPPAENGETALPPAAQTAPTATADMAAPRARVTARVTQRTQVKNVTPHSAQRAPSARQAISLPPETVEGRAVLPPARKISFGSSADPLLSPFNEPPRAEIVPAHATATAPAGPDVPVILEVGDFVDRLPSSFLQTAALDRQRKVEFRSSELYSDLTRGRASVPASVIYKKCADIFSRPVSPTEDIEVALPLQKLVEQMSGAFQTRPDQVSVENVGEIETPFRQVALEDNARLPRASGTSAGPIAAPAAPAAPKVAAAPAPAEPPLREHHRTGHISTITPPKPGAESAAPPTAHSAGAPAPLKRPPSTVRASVAGAKIRVSGAVAGNRSMAPVGHSPSGASGSSGAPGNPALAQPPGPMSMAAAAASPSHQVSKKTARIQIPPISLRPAGAPPKPASPAPPTGPTVPLQPSPVSARPAPGADPLPTFRSSPGVENRATATFRSSPPPIIKPPPPSFAPRTKLAPAPSAATPTPPEATKAPEPAAPPVPTAPLTAASTPAPDNRQVSLKLAAILRGLPTTASATVPDETSISIPLRLIEPQLSSGRVAIPLAAFIEALPPEYRGVLAAEAGLAEVPLPLPEIFMNLPSSALSIRADQVAEEAGTTYLTPFSQKAEEDAERFSAGAIDSPSAKPEPGAPPVALAEAPAKPAPADEPPVALAKTAPPPEVPEPAAVPSTVPLPAPVMASPEPDKAPEVPPAAVAAVVPPAVVASEKPESPTPAIEAAEDRKPLSDSANGAAAAPPIPAASAPVETVLQKLFMTEDEMDAKTVVKLVSQMPGINGCAVMFGDGLRLAGNFPENGHAEGFSAMSPPFYKRTMNFASELKLGELQAFTIYTNTGLLSFFMHDDICMSVRHAGRGFFPGVREKLESVTRELAQMYSAAAPVAAAS
jgi:predicted regulator of Ras-like GTPase activity (Roadblock/LC7/MglB family)